MIPTIEDILRAVAAGEMDQADALAFINAHLELQARELTNGSSETIAWFRPVQTGGGENPVEHDVDVRLQSECPGTTKEWAPLCTKPLAFTGVEFDWQRDELIIDGYRYSRGIFKDFATQKATP